MLKKQVATAAAVQQRKAELARRSKRATAKAAAEAGALEERRRAKAAATAAALAAQAEHEKLELERQAEEVRIPSFPTAHAPVQGCTFELHPLRWLSRSESGKRERNGVASTCCGRKWRVSRSRRRRSCTDWSVR